MDGLKTVKRGEILRQLLVLSLPAVIEHLMGTLMQYVDTAMVGHLGEQATAAVSTTTTINWLVGSVSFAIPTAALALISRANGAGNREEMRRLTGQGVLLSFAAGVIFTILSLALSPFIPVWMGAEEAVRGPASEYFFIISLPLIFRMGTVMCGAAVRATKNTKLPMAVNMAANVLNVVLNYLLIYTFGLGVRGAAIATALATAISGIVMIYAARRKEALRWHLSDMRPDRALLSQYARIGLPAMGNSAISSLGYVFFAGMVSGMGTTIFAAHSIAVTAEGLFYMPGFGLRTATSALIGNALGEKDPGKMHVTEYLSIAVTVFLMTLSGIVLYIVAFPLMKLFTISDAVAYLGAQVLRIVAFTEPFFGLMIVLEGIFYGKGKTNGIFIVETGSMWGIRILFTFLGVHFWGFTLHGVWYCMIADNICKALLLLAVYLRDRKKNPETV